MEIQKNSRQMPCSRSVLRDKDYCDLLYAWVQCNSERVDCQSPYRRIEKDKVKWSKIEKDFEYFDIEKNRMSKKMERRTIAKYFKYLLDKGLVKDLGDDYYYLELLPNNEANLIEYHTLSVMMDTMKRHFINIYIYLFNRYYANGCQPFIATMKQIKTFLGFATSTTSNNHLITSSFAVLKRLGLMDYVAIKEGEKTLLQFLYVRNKL